MNKLSKLFVVLMLLLLPNVVFADELEKNHILSIENFDISGSTISIGGYSYVSHVDNWGGRNLKTYIVAYTDNYSESWENKNWSFDEKKCEKSSECYYKPANVVTDRNMWYARCTDAGCKTTASGKTAHEDTKDKRNNTAQFTNNCNGELVNQCLYEAVGFSVTIDLADIADEFSSGENFTNNINFRIVSEVSIKGNIVYSVNSPLRVYTPICTVNINNNKKKCSDGSNANIVSGDYAFTLNGLSDTVYYDAVSSLARDSDGTRIAGQFFQEGEDYTVLGYSSSVKSIDKIVDGFSVGEFSDLLLRLDSKLTTEDYTNGGVSGKKIVPGDGIAAGSPSNGYDYYTIATFVVFEGNLVINGFKPVVEPITCSDAGWGGTPKTKNDVSCSNSGDYNQCVKVDNVKSSGDNYIYVLAKEQSSACEGMGGKVKLSDGKYYTKVEVSTNLLFNQTATFTFGSVNPSVVYAGKGFTLGETIYDNNVTWMNANKTGSGKPHYKYTASDYVLSGGSCVLNESFNINDFSYYKYKDSDGYTSTTSLEDASFVVMDRIARSYIKANVIDDFVFKSCDSNDSSGCDVDNPDVEVKGKWSSERAESSDYYYRGIKFGKTNLNSYSYELADSYIYVSGDEIGKAEYIEDAASIIDDLVKNGKKFYVDFKWIYEGVWPFDLKNNINPSFVRGMDWELNGFCDVKVKDGYYTDAEGDDPYPDDPDDPGDPDDPDNIPDPDYPGGGVLRLSYRYRSISLKNPFPKGKFAKNWKDWYAEESNRNRISDTYNRGIKYRIKIDRAKASLIRSVNGYYNQLTDFDFNGTSDFVSGKFDEINVSAGVNYCGLGFFATDCDKI